jgi:RNA-directed DNA polymerase
VSEPKPK